jgi:hypothetical protein
MNEKVNGQIALFSFLMKLKGAFFVATDYCEQYN